MSVFVLMAAFGESYVLLVCNTSQPMKTVSWQNLTDNLAPLYIVYYNCTFFNILPAPTIALFLQWLQVFHLMFLSNQLKLATIY